MDKWKLNIFVNAIKSRIAAEGKTAEFIITEYPKLIEAEKTEILAAITT